MATCKICGKPFKIIVGNEGGKCPICRRAAREAARQAKYPLCCDQQSLQCLAALPKRIGLAAALLPFLKILAAPFLFIGGIGAAKELLPVLTKGPEYDYALQHIGSYVLLLALVFGILGIGGLLWFLANHFMFEKAPLGDLAKVLFEETVNGKIDRVRTIAKSICIQTEGRESDSLAVSFLRGLAFETLAETSPDEESAQKSSREAIPLLKRAKELGLNTPLLNFLLANSLRIVKANQEAIAVYETYLNMRPSDDGTKKILDTLTTEESQVDIHGTKTDLPKAIQPASKVSAKKGWTRYVPLGVIVAAVVAVVAGGVVTGIENQKEREFIGSLRMVPQNQLGNPSLEGIYSMAGSTLVLLHDFSYYVLVFTAASDLSAVGIRSNPASSTAVIYGRTIYWDSKLSYHVNGRRSTYAEYDYIETGRRDALGRPLYKRGDRTDHYMIEVSKILP